MDPVFRQIAAVARKDLKSEVRTRYALNSLGMFVVITVAVVAFASAGERLTAGLASGLFWVSMFFTAVTGLGRSFISEEERGTSLLLRLTVTPTSVYFGKLLVNVLISVVSNLLLAGLLFAMLSDLRVGSQSGFFVVILLSSFGFASALTLIAALIARAGAKGALYPVLAFPVLLPLIILGVDLMRRSMLGGRLEDMGGDLLLTALYTTSLILVGYVLFEFLWRE